MTQMIKTAPAALTCRWRFFSVQICSAASQSHDHCAHSLAPVHPNILIAAQVLVSRSPKTWGAGASKLPGIQPQGFVSAEATADGALLLWKWGQQGLLVSFAYCGVQGAD